MDNIIKISDKRKRQCAKMIENSKDVIDKAFKEFPHDQIGITWTGGKDSGLVLWIIRLFCQERNYPIPKTMIIGEGDEFEEIQIHVEQIKKEWNVPLETCRNEDVLRAAGHKLGNLVKVSELNERNKAELNRIGFTDAGFMFEAESYVGNHLMKTVVFNQWLKDNNIKAIFQGIRWDEHHSRFDDRYFEYKEEGEMSPAHTRIRPILHFTEKDLWDTYAAFDIPFCKLYEQGYRSLGAKSTSKKKDAIPAWKQDIENTEERSGRHQEKENTMEKLRALGYM